MSTPTPDPRPCLSVVMPAYNEQATVRTAIDAVLASPWVAQLVVVDDDRVQPQRAGDGERAVVAAAAVEGQEQGDAVGREAADGRLVQPVAVAPRRQLDEGRQRPGRGGPQGQRGDRRRGDAVGVVVAEHGHGLAPVDGFFESCGGLVHIQHQHGVPELLLSPVQKFLRLLGVVYASQGEHHRLKRRAACLQQRPGSRRIVIWSFPVCIIHFIAVDSYFNSLF